MPEDPKVLLRRLSGQQAARVAAANAERQQQALGLLGNLKARNVFYYPGCGTDFSRPVTQFCDRCDTFIFCDWLFGTWSGEAGFAEWVDGFDQFPITAICPLPDESVRQLAALDEEWASTVGFVAEEAQAEIRVYLKERPEPKGHYLQIQVGARRFDVFLFAAEGTNLYLKLFAKRSAAPRILCIKNWGHIGGEWTPFGNWEAHLGKAVRARRVASELLVAREGDHDWPWPIQVERFEDWDDRPVVMWRKETTNMSTEQNPKDQPTPKPRRPSPFRRKNIKPGYEPRPKRTHLPLLLGKLKADKK
jgi:hypothetical protein